MFEECYTRSSGALSGVVRIKKAKLFTSLSFVLRCRDQHTTPRKYPRNPQISSTSRRKPEVKNVTIGEVDNRLTPPPPPRLLDNRWLHCNNKRSYSSSRLFLTIRIMFNPVKTQFSLLFSTTCFGLEGRHQFEHKNKFIYIYIQFILNWDFKTSQFTLLCGYRQHGKNNLGNRICVTMFIVFKGLDAVNIGIK
jgi:hypothetical protein